MPLTPAITRRKSSLSGSSFDAKVSIEWSSVNSVLEDAVCRGSSIPCGTNSRCDGGGEFCCCAMTSAVDETATRVRKTTRESLMLRLAKVGLYVDAGLAPSVSQPHAIRTQRIAIS